MKKPGQVDRSGDDGSGRDERRDVSGSGLSAEKAWRPAVRGRRQVKRLKSEGLRRASVLPDAVQSGPRKPNDAEDAPAGDPAAQAKSEPEESRRHEAVGQANESPSKISG